MEASESDSSSSEEIESSSSGTLPSEEDASQSRHTASNHGHHYQQTTINSGQAHLGDVHIINNVFQSAALPNESLKLPTGSRERRTSTSRSRERRRKWMVPRPSSSYFTGRRLQLEQLRSSLFPYPPDEAALRKVAVVLGLGGSGKTQFCLKFAETYKEEYWGVFWIDASNKETASLGYAELGSLFGRGASAAAGKYWLSQVQKPWLLILDNADNDDLDITNFFPSGTVGHIILTTRRQSLEEYATVGTIRLDKMDPDEAINLLLNSAYSEKADQRKQPESRSIAQNIAERLGYLAIALHQAGTTIRCKICTLEKYLSFYLGYRLRPPSISIPSKDDVIATWEVPFQRLESRANMAYQDAVALFHILAFMHHQPVHESIIQASWSQAGDDLVPDNDLPEILRCSSMSVDQLQARLRLAFSILYEHSIVEFDSDIGSCSIHPVIHEWARHRIEERGKTSFWLRCTAYVLACVGSDGHQILHEYASEFLPSHLDSFLDYADHFEPMLLQTSCGMLRLERLASLYERGGQWQKALKLLDSVINYQAKTKGSRHNDTLRAKRNASLCHWNLFQVGQTLELQRQIWQARWWSRNSMLDWAHPLRPQHVEYGIALSDLTQSLWLAGDLARSKKAGERAVAVLKNSLGQADLHTLEATFNLGRTYRHLGLLQQAHTMLTFVLRKRKTTLGLNHLDTLMVRNEVGMNFCGLKKHLALAEKMIRNVLTARERILGAEHAYTLWSVNDLSKVLCARGRFDGAIRILEDIIPAVVRTLGKQHVGMHMTKGNLARAYAYCSRWNQTERVLAEMLADDQLGQGDRLRSMMGLARIQARLGKLADAERTCGQLLSLLEASGSAADRAKTENTAAGLLAGIYLGQGHHERSEELRKLYPKMDVNVLDQPFELT